MLDAATVRHGQWPLNLLKTERDEVKAAVGIDADKKRKYDESQKQIGVDELALTRLDCRVEPKSRT